MLPAANQVHTADPTGLDWRVNCSALLGGRPTVPVSELYNLVIGLVLVWMWVFGDPNVENSSPNTRDANIGAPRKQIVDILPNGQVNGETGNRRKNIAMSMGWKAGEPKREIAVVAALDDEAIQSVRCAVLLDNFHAG
jgi:hypothetical protein